MLPQGTFGKVWAHFGIVTAVRGGVLVASSGQRSGMTVNILQCTGQAPTTKNHPASNVNGTEVEKRCRE